MSGIRPPSSASGRATPTGRSTPVQSSRRESVLLSQSSASGASGSGSSGGSTSVQVALRIRPVTAQDSVNIPQRFQRTVIHVTSANSLSVENVPSSANPNAPPVPASKQSKQNFNFDRVISPAEGQSGVYRVAEPLIDKFLEGYNVTILAYGQTGSGKSYTMGTDYQGGSLEADASEDVERWGVIPRAVNEMFQKIREQTSETKKFSIKNSYIEIYNEDLIDLLNERGRDAPHGSVTIREDKEGKIIWSGLRELGVNNVQEVMMNLAQGSSLRQTSSTDMNAQSSRSHAIFSITLTQKKYTGSNPHPPQPSATNKRASFQPGRSLQSPTSGRSTPSGIPERPGSRFGLRGSIGTGGRPVSPGPNSLGDGDEEVGEWTTITSKFHFVDLAGSERLKRTSAVGERAKEGISINSGLHALGNVISALGDPAKARQTTHIPYRDSKLTRLLQDSLGGNAHTLMIACASGSEYNLAETLNTLKYANRARNIKNRAELNEVEVGWDDVEYLQKVVLKLREELNALRGGNGNSLRTINEEGSVGGAGGAALLELQEQYSELSQKYAKMTAELTKAQTTPQIQGAIGHHLTPEEFEQAVAPVVQEYEKSLSALESQLALTKAALVHAEDSMKDQEEKLLFEQQVNEKNVNLIDELKSRVAKLAEREALTETYVRDLESKLKAEADRQDVDADVVADLKREIQKYKEMEVNNEQYIKDLENRLTKAEDGALALQGQVEQLEKEVERKEALYKDLESRMLLLDQSDQHKLILDELEEKERRLLDLERSLEELKEEKEGVEQEKETLNQIIERTTNDKIELELQLRNLKEERDAERNASLGVGAEQKQMTPPHTPHINQPSDTQLDLEYKLEQLQRQHSKALSELDVINQKYKESLKEIEDLAQQVEEARLISSESQDVLPSPLPSPGLHHSTSFPTLRGVAWERDTDVPPVPPLPHSARAESFGNKSYVSKSPRSRRSMPLAAGPRLSFLAQPKTPSNQHLRSVSLSQELSSAQGGLSSFPQSPRAHSPIGLAPIQNERSYESLEKEVMQLQETLRSREDEITLLEKSLRDLERLESTSSTKPNVNLPNPLDQKQASKEPMITPPPLPAATNTNGSYTPEQSPHMSPQTLSAFSALKAELAELNGPSEFTEEELQARLDKLMRSMAHKESTHRQVVDELQDQLTGLTRQHEDLKALSHNQVINMSAEIENLRCQIKIGEQNEVLKEKLAEMDASLKKAAEETEAVRTQSENHLKEAMRTLINEHRTLLDQNAEEHAAAIRQLKEEHTLEIRKTLDERDELLNLKTVELETALQTRLKEHEEVLRRKETEHATTLEAKNEQHIAALRQREEEHAMALHRFEESLSARNGDDVNAALSSAKMEHSVALAKRDADHEAALASLKSEHSAALLALQTDHVAATERLTADQERVISRMMESQAEAINRLREERDADLQRLSHGHAEEITSLKALHEKKLQEAHEEAERQLADLRLAHKAHLADSSREHEAELSSMQSNHESAISERVTALSTEYEEKIKTLEDNHQSAITSLSSKHEQALTDLTAKHAEALEQLRTQHVETVSSLEQAFQKQVVAHQEEIADAQVRSKDELDASLQRLKDEHIAAIAALSSEHAMILSKTNTTHDEILEQLKLHHSKTMSEQQEAHSALLAETKSHFESFETTNRELTNTSTVLQTEKIEMTKEIEQLQDQLRQAEAAKDALTSKLQMLMDHIDEDTAAHEDEKQRLELALAEARDSLQASRVSMDSNALESELQESQDALNTMEKALKESQIEKERLIGQVEELRVQVTQQVPTDKYDSLVKELDRQQSFISRVQSDFELIRSERDALFTEKGHQQQYIKELQLQIANSIDASSNGHHGRQDSVDVTRSPRMSPTLHSATLSVNGVNGMKPVHPHPPPTPPPTMPPPPAPPSSTTTSTRPRNSSSSSITRNSDSPPTSVRSPTNSMMTDSITIDARVARKLEEQELLIGKYAKQLQDVQSELQANVDLVNTLESALNDSERNLRKARMQMNDLSKERDNFQRQNDQLRQQILETRQEMDTIRSREQAVESRLEQERLAKESAKNQLERRMEEMSRRKSKFNCF